MDLRSALGAVIRAPKRFLDWVYEPTPRTAPTRGEAIVHLRSAALGQDSTRWMDIEAEERRQQERILRETVSGRSERGDPG